MRSRVTLSKLTKEWYRLYMDAKERLRTLPKWAVQHQKRKRCWEKQKKDLDKALTLISKLEQKTIDIKKLTNLLNTIS